MKPSRSLYRAARTARDVEAIESGEPKRIARRAKNRIIGRVIWRLVRRIYR